jgi:hypothetical protein
MLSQVRHPEVWSAGRVPWQFFCTLTWANVGAHRNRPPSPSKQVTAFFAFARGAAHVSGRHFRELVWLLRHEPGEITGRSHYHCLLSVVGSEWVRRSTCFYLMHYWEKRLGCGHARVRIFRPAMGGLEYTMKDLAESLRGADRYEFGKFFEPSAALTLSASANRLISRRQRMLV